MTIIRSKSRRALAAVGLTLALAATAAVATPASAGAGKPAPPDLPEPALPIVFVHGASGSGAQYETQALRWASNGYPNVVTAVDRRSANPAVVYPQLDAFFADVLAETGDEQLYVLGHSLGTAVMAGYLSSSPERADTVAKYIGIDGFQSPTCPGGVECMGIWARGNPDGVLGANNVHFDEQGHTESVGSPESFGAQYEFLTGASPATTDILPEPPGQVEVSGRLLNFAPFTSLENTGIDGALLEVWEVDAATGVRKDAEPVASYDIDETGNFGPVRVNGKQRYEIAVRRMSEGDEFWQHFYYEPWIRDNHLLRLNLAPIGSILSEAIERGPHTTVSVVRQREWWGDNPVDESDVDDLFVSTTSPGAGDEAPVDIVNGGTAPYSSSTIAIIGFDIEGDQQSDVSQLFPLQVFINGVDIYMPATEPADGTVTFRHVQRGHDADQTINTPNWSSEDGHGMSVTFRDWEQGTHRPNACASPHAGCR